MSRQYTHVQELLPSVLAMKGIQRGYLPQPKGRPRKAPGTQEQLQNNRIVELEMKVELLQNFLSESGRM